VTEPGTPLLSGWRYRAVIWSVVIAAAGYLAFALWGGWNEVVHALARVGFVGITVSLALSLVNYGLRFVRWQAYLRAMDHPVPWAPSLAIYVAGFALTTTPGKAGEALRGVLLKRWGVPYPQSLAAFLSERLSDLVAILLLTLFGLSIYPAAEPMMIAGALAVLAAYFVVSSPRPVEMLLQRLHGEGRLAKLLRHGSQVLLQARRCHSPGLIVGATALSLVGWAAEAWTFHLILHWMGLDVSLEFAVFVYAISMLAGALSFMPGGLGSAEGVMVSLLIWKGAPGADAIAATVLIRLATLWFAVALGCVTLARLTGQSRHGEVASELRR
jgi:uncharacterized protein (TIRG00374 family)